MGDVPLDSAPDAIKLIGYGADEIDHLIAMGIAELPAEETYDELFRLMVERGTWFVPTIAIVRTYNHLVLERSSRLPRRYFIPHFRKAYEAGVRMGCGWTRALRLFCGDHRYTRNSRDTSTTWG